MASEHMLGGETKGEIVAGDFVHGENVKDGRVDEQIDEDDGEEAGEDGARNQVTRVFHFVAKIDDAIPAIVGVDGGLNAKEQSSNESGAHGDNDGSHGLGECGGFGGMAQMATESEAGNDDREKCQALENSGDILDFAA